MFRDSRSLVEDVLASSAAAVARKIEKSFEGKPSRGSLTEMALTKQHFIAIAAAIREMPQRGNKRKDVADMLVRIFKGSNPMFDPKRFYRACGLTLSGAEGIMEAALTRKHFIAMAEAIKQLPKQNLSRMQIAKAMAGVFLDDNPRFNEDRFMRACGVNVGAYHRERDKDEVDDEEYESPSGGNDSRKARFR
jgi:hypothetical protein